MRHFPAFSRRHVTSLNGVWDFTFVEDLDLDSVQPASFTYDDVMCVPGAYDATPRYTGKRGTGIYRSIVDVPAGQRSKLVFNGAGIWVRVYVDGQEVIEHAKPYSVFSCELPRSTENKREIVILVDNRLDFKRSPLQQYYFDFYAYGGLFREVSLHVLPECSFEQTHVKIEDVDQGNIEVVAKLSGTVPESLTLNAGFDGGETTETLEVPVVDNTATFKLTVPNPTPWSPEEPNLHTLTLDSGSDDMTVRFGLRIIETRKQDVLVNGKPVSLIGVCRHEAHPQFGPATPLHLQLNDLQQIRSLGFRFIRGVHYPQDPRFLDLCDEMGMLVWEESIGWGQKRDCLTDPKLKRLVAEQTAETIDSSFNHPSIILWGFLNEGVSNDEESSEIYDTLINLIREKDPSRLVTYASNRTDADLHLEKLDVISYNVYPAWYKGDIPEDGAIRPLEDIPKSLRGYTDRLAERGLGDRPFILSEIGAGGIYGWRDPLNSWWSEDYQADYMDTVMKEVHSNPAITGISLWQFVDCRTYAGPHALRRPRAFNNKGIVDEYRRPKETFRRLQTQAKQQGKSE